MEKAKANLLIAFVVVTIACIVMVVNAIALNTQLNTMRPKAERCDALEAELANLRVKYDEQVTVARNLQDNLNAVRRETDSLRTVNTDLQNRLNTSLNELETLRASAAPAVAPAE